MKEILNLKSSDKELYKVRRIVLMTYYFRLFLLLVGLAFPGFSFAIEESTPVKITLVSEEKTIQPGRSFWVAVQLDLEKDWHVYWKNPGDAGFPLKLNWKLPEGFQAEPLQWPFPEKFTFENMVGFGYHDEVTILTRITPPSHLEPGTEVQLKGNASWLVCSSVTCLPGSAPVSVNLKVDSAAPEIDSANAEIFKVARAKMPRVHAEAKAIHKEGILQLQVPKLDLDQGSITGVYFFPENQKVVDSSVDPVMSLDQLESDQRCLVNLKGGEEIGVKTKNLKGVLVVHTNDKEAEGILAFDIDSPIHDNDDDFLSFVETKSKFEETSSIGSQSISSTNNKVAFEGGLGLALAFAFVGGMILNLMPCVLPVMSFKVMSFVKMAGQSRTLTIKHGLVFSLGVVISFWVLASIMLLLRTYGQAVGWGFQLQEPLFVVILASLLFVFALSLFGVFEWGLFVASWAGQTQAEKSKQSSSGYMASFFSGVMATAVATPCTGPFLGSAVGFAVTLPVIQSLLIFTVLGLGMCFPYLLLAAFPSYLRFLPKPGAWMEIFKHLMGFLLLATVLWLLWVFSAQTNTLSLICLLAGFLCFSVGAWLYGQGSSPLVSKPKRMISYVCVVLIVVVGCQVILMPRNSWYATESVDHKAKGAWAGWEEFSPERVAELQKQGKPVLIDFTAKWCLICQANHLVLDSEEVAGKLDDREVVKLKADWTRSDPVITEELSKFGRNSVPLYVLYGTDSKPVILPQVLTPDVVLDHLDKAVPQEEIASN